MEQQGQRLVLVSAFSLFFALPVAAGNLWRNLTLTEESHYE